MLLLCPKTWIKMKLLRFHQNLIYIFFSHVWDMWAILWFLTSQNYPLYKNSSVENQTWLVTNPFERTATLFFALLIQSYINANIFHPWLVNMQLSSFLWIVWVWGVAFYTFLWFVATAFYTASFQLAIRSGERWRIKEVMVIMHV